MQEQIVQILLSTYNGEEYLTNLLDSLLAQDYPKVEIIIRDDGSKDSTNDILKRYSKLPNIKVVYGDNIGATRSFFKLLELSSSDAAYISFCDQDDVWQKDKISRAIELLQTATGPAAYCSSVKVVDKNLKERYISSGPPKGAGFRNALVENIMTGCTIVINKAARELVLQKLPSRALMHDWWIYLVISAFGSVIFDCESRIMYRQHGGNAIGTSKGFSRWIKRVKRLVGRGSLRPVTDQALEFKMLYGGRLDSSNRDILERFLTGRDTFTKRLSYSLSGQVYRQSLLDDLILRLLIVTNLI